MQISILRKKSKTMKSILISIVYTFACVFVVFLIKMLVVAIKDEFYSDENSLGWLLLLISLTSANIILLISFIHNLRMSNPKLEEK